MAEPAPPDDVEFRKLHFVDDGTVPNNPALPAILMRGALGGGADPQAVTALLEANGWTGTWVWQVFPYHHYHPNAHEVLAVATGEATLMLGGPGGERVEVAAGDVIMLPPGTGHCQVVASGNFRICGAYPPGQSDYETVRADAPADDTMRDRIAAVPRPGTDPVWGDGGPLLPVWAGTTDG
ncbi:cupin domain-containing protein [uncultured Jannaschia sp.]|uniref:cupin domain-containing protein n=1 Tax=uncultured Jannaschia sp. TaxID=293347 RepID=UPI00260A888B|nr:cupin domain-containing protein [uncultured Jannaschia sp.]